MEEQEIVRLVQSLLTNLQIEIAEVASVSGNTATVKRQGQTVTTKSLPTAIGLNLAIGDRVVLLRPGGDLNAAIIVAKITGQGLSASYATNASNANSANTADKVDGIHFRVSNGTLQWSQDGSSWTNA